MSRRKRVDEESESVLRERQREQESCERECKKL